MTCEYDQIATARLIPYARNARTHNDAQVAQIAASIKEFGFLAPVVVDSDYGIMAGHGRVLAARMLGLETVPCVRADHLTENQKRAYIIADNRLTETSEWDTQMLALEMEDLRLDGYNIGLAGFSSEALQELMDGGNNTADGDDTSPEDSCYTAKTEIPIYTPSGEDVRIEEMFDTTKADDLRSAIASANLAEDVRVFLDAAASRHIVFNYRKIADYYASAPPAIQRLMESSALVLVDFDRAIECGFVKMTKTLRDLYAVQEGSGL